MADKFDILIEDLERVRANGASFGVFGEDSHNYELNPPLSEAELAGFENDQGIHLPSDYREFLVRVGNGGAGPYYGLFKLGEMDDGFDFGPWGDFVGLLSAPFPYLEAWNDLTGEPQDEGATNDHEFDQLIEAFEKRYFDTSHVQGAIPICHLGCALRQWLVITGPEAGNVWCDDRADRKGLHPLMALGRKRTTFFSWYRDWLDEVLAKVQLWEQRTSKQ